MVLINFIYLILTSGSRVSTVFLGNFSHAFCTSLLVLKAVSANSVRSHLCHFGCFFSNTENGVLKFKIEGEYRA
jgi:hypothetical protein